MEEGEEPPVHPGGGEKEEGAGPRAPKGGEGEEGAGPGAPKGGEVVAEAVAPLPSYNLCSYTQCNVKMFMVISSSKIFTELILGKRWSFFLNEAQKHRFNV